MDTLALCDRIVAEIEATPRTTTDITLELCDEIVARFEFKTTTYLGSLVASGAKVRFECHTLHD